MPALLIRTPKMRPPTIVTAFYYIQSGLVHFLAADIQCGVEITDQNPKALYFSPPQASGQD